MKKLKILLIIMLAFVMLFAFIAETRAADETGNPEKMYLNIVKEIPEAEEGKTSKYMVDIPNGTLETFFKIVKEDDGVKTYDQALYCLRHGLGFGDSERVPVNDLNPTEYTNKYDLKEDGDTIRKNVYDNKMTLESYHAILWIVENMYLPKHPDATKMRNQLLEAAFKDANINISESQLTDNDIEFVQQMALWYFSNFDEQGEEGSISFAFGEDLTGLDSFDLAGITLINGANIESEERKNQINALYKFFIEKASRAQNTSNEDSAYLTKATLWIATDEDQPVLKVEKIKKGEFNIEIKKIDKDAKTDKNGEIPVLSGAQFTLKDEADENGKAKVLQCDEKGFAILEDSIKIDEDAQCFIYTITEAVTPGGYIGLQDPFKICVKTGLDEEKTEYVVKDVYFVDDNKERIDTVENVEIKSLANNTITIVVKNEKIKVFDLALRKYITKINEEPITTRKPNIKWEELNKNGVTTAEYKHRKDPIEVKNGDKVTYTISVYNEGEVDGIVTSIIDYLPEGLEFVELVENEKYSADVENGKLTISSKEGEELFTLNKFNETDSDTASIEIVCEVTAQAEKNDIILTNIATMEYKSAVEGIDDRDSKAETKPLEWPTTAEEMANYTGHSSNPSADLGIEGYFYKGQEDDDDFEKVVIRGVPFDLALRKFITEVNGVPVEKTREPEIVSTEKLDNRDENGNSKPTFTYSHSKEPVVVKKGDIVTYKIRVYNEGDLDGYATKIVDYIPEGLGYLMGYVENTNNYWVPELSDTTKTINLVGEDGLYKNEAAIKNLKAEQFDTEKLNDVKILVGNAKISTDALEEEKIKAYNSEITVEKIEENENWQASKEGTDGLYYEEVEVTCIVLAENTFEGKIRNIAEIYEDKADVTENDDEKELVDANDRDSTPKNVDIEDYDKQQQDDDDYELLELKYFDLALRKFITAVNEEEVTTRVPEAKIKEDGELEYIHSKEPVYVENSDLVTYTIRVYNEGTVKGYATEISDDIPAGLVFLPEHKLNEEYKWKMYDSEGKETEDITKAVEIRTSYLDDELLNAYDATKAISATEPLNPDYADVKVVFQVIEENITAEDRIVINKAQIAKDKAVEIKEDENGTKVETELDLEDEDSIPGKWNEKEDDQDIEKIYVKKFDLALLKWVTKTIVTVDGKTTTTETGFTPYDDPEPIAKVIIDKKKLNKTSVKFAYNIMIENQGEIAGYAMEITDYIPEGLEFVAEDNPLWTKDGEGKITTRALESKLLQPGEKATVEVIFTWKNDSENFGLKTNIAEISEDYNDKGAKDIDSTPDDVEIKDYDKQQEDDDDKALVILEVKTGGEVSYIWLGLVVLVILAVGIVLIQKFVI